MTYHLFVAFVILAIIYIKIYYIALLIYADSFVYLSTFLATRQLINLKIYSDVYPFSKWLYICMMYTLVFRYDQSCKEYCYLKSVMCQLL